MNTYEFFSPHLGNILFEEKDKKAITPIFDINGLRKFVKTGYSDASVISKFEINIIFFRKDEEAMSRVGVILEVFKSNRDNITLNFVNFHNALF